MFKLNTQRTYRYPVTITVFDEAGKEHTGKFSATFRATGAAELQARGDEPLLDLVLVDVHELAIDGADGKPLEGEALLAAAKADPACSTALIAAYQESIVKKNRPQR